MTPALNNLWRIRGRAALVFIAVMVWVIEAKFARSQTMAFPGAQGFGRLASSGRNSAIYHVTSLAESKRAGITTNGVSLSVIPEPEPSLAAGLVSDGAVQLSLTGEAGQSYRVWASTNVCLTPVTNAWTLLSEGVFGGGSGLVVDSQATNFMQ